jgi:hypothetical protein
MINIYQLPDLLINKILLYLENPEAKLIKNFRGYNNVKYAMFSFLKYNRNHLPYGFWLSKYDVILGYPYNKIYISKYNMQTYNDYEDLWETIDELSTDSDFDLDSI